MSAPSHSPTPPARGSTGWWFVGFCIEVSVEDAIALEVQAGADVEGNPARIVLLQRSKGIIGIARERFCDLSPFAGTCLAFLRHVRDDRKPIARRSSGADRIVATAIEGRNMRLSRSPSQV